MILFNLLVLAIFCLGTLFITVTVTGNTGNRPAVSTKKSYNSINELEDNWLKVNAGGILLSGYAWASIVSTSLIGLPYWHLLWIFPSGLLAIVIAYLILDWIFKLERRFVLGPYDAVIDKMQKTPKTALLYFIVWLAFLFIAFIAVNALRFNLGPTLVHLIEISVTSAVAGLLGAILNDLRLREHLRSSTRLIERNFGVSGYGAEAMTMSILFFLYLPLSVIGIIGLSAGLLNEAFMPGIVAGLLLYGTIYLLFHWARLKPFF